VFVKVTSMIGVLLSVISVLALYSADSAFGNAISPESGENPSNL